MLKGFAALLADMDTMAKAFPAAGDKAGKDKKIEAAAGDDADKGAKEPTSEEKKAAEEAAAIVAASEADKKEKGEGDVVTKSFKFTDKDGVEHEAIDGTEMMKSLSERIEGSEDSLIKAFGTLVDIVKSRDEVIKSLSAKVDELAASGRGRKAVITVIDPVKAADKSAEGVSPADFMAKSMIAFTAGKIRAEDIATIEARLNRGLDVPDHLKSAVLA